MTITDTGTATAATSDTALTVSGVAAPANDCYLLVAVGISPGGSAVSSVSGGTGTFIKVAGTDDTQTYHVELWVGYNFGSSAPTSITVNRTGLAGDNIVTAVVRTLDLGTGTAITEAPDYTASAGNFDASGTAHDCNTLTPAVGDILFAAVYHSGSASSAQTDTGNDYIGNTTHNAFSRTIEAMWCEAASAVSSKEVWTGPNGGWAAIQAAWPLPGAGPISVDPPSALVSADSPAPTLSMPINVNPPSALIEAEALAPGVGAAIEIDPPSAQAEASAVAPDSLLFGAVFNVLLPDDETTLPTSTPMFVSAPLIMFDHADNRVQIEYDDNSGFTSPVTRTSIPAYIDGIGLTVMAAAGALGDGTYYWRARIRVGSTWLPWTDTRSFTIDAAAGLGTADGAMTVIDGDPPAHLWFVRPDAGVVGDAVTLYGMGLVGTGTEAVTLAGETAVITSAGSISAGGDAYTEDRIIDAVDGDVDVEHDRVIVTVPDVAAPGGELFLERS